MEQVRLKRLEMGETSGECSHCPAEKWYEIECVENVFTNILSRLPAKSLLVCKSVCKHWHKLINSQAFIDLHLLWSKNHSIYIVYPNMDIMMKLYLMDSGEITERFTFPFCGNLSRLAIVCSFHGLLCCINYPWKVASGQVVEDVTDLEIRICNPVTRKVLLLPEGSPSQKIPSIGVAFGPQINEYKIFRFFLAKHINLAKPQCEVYSSSTRSWSILGCVPYSPMRYCHSPLGSNHVFVNGKIYWFIESDEDRSIPGSILTVDIKENFGTISLPKEVTEHTYLVDLGGCLSVVAVYDEDGVVNVWILEDENKPKWELKCSVDIPFPNDECVEFIAARVNEIFFITSYHYFIYDLERRVWRELDLNSSFEETSFPVAFQYTESLLSCGGRMDPQTEDLSNIRRI